MRKKGSVYISTVFIILIIVIILLFVYKAIYSEEVIFKNFQTHIQSDYYSESYINELFSEKNKDALYENLIENFYKHKTHFTIPFSSSLLTPDAKINKTIVNILDTDDPSYCITLESSYKDAVSTIQARGRLISSLFIDQPIVSKSVDEEAFLEFKKNFSFAEFDIGNLNWSGIFKGENQSYIVEGSNIENYFYTLKQEESEEEFKHLEFSSGLSSVLYDFSKGTYYFESPVHLNGIVYINSDIILNSPIDVKGIVILDGGSIEANGHTVNVKGQLINLYESNENSFNVVYDAGLSQLYYKVIPNIFSPTLESIKKSQQNYFQ